MTIREATQQFAAALVARNSEDDIDAAVEAFVSTLEQRLSQASEALAALSEKL